MEIIKSTSRLLELIIGFIGGFISLVGSSFVLLIGSLTSQFTIILGAIAIIGSLLGILASYYVMVDAKLGGIVLILSTILVLLGSSIFGVIGAIFLLAAGMLALFRD